ncbi:hypothetical protein ACVWZ3_004980 [Bradyrhizobium sp. i1.3.6]
MPRCSIQPPRLHKPTSHPWWGTSRWCRSRPKGTKEAAAKPAAAPKGKPQSIAARLQACLDLDDGTKDRLNCYDAVIAPQPKPKPAKAKGYADCRFFKEEDERLACFNGFAESIPKLPKT